ncbi:MAG: YbjN domain-containing protein [Cyanobacteria bacterium SBLK]|nr:YbjN domain-containing protein [Cyanobacteria bacterium SBLK]
MNSKIFLQQGIELTIISISLNQSDRTIPECYATFLVDWETYQRIETENLLNLKPQTRSDRQNVPFESDRDIEISALLHPQHLPHLTPHTSDREKLLQYLEQLNRDQPQHPLFASENWFALSVKQRQNGEEIGYRTLWSHISPSTLLREDLSEAEISTAIQNYFQDWAAANLPAIAADTDPETVDEFAESLEQFLVQQMDAIAQNATAELGNALNNALTPNNGTTPNTSLFETLIRFFTQDDWSFLRVEGETALRLGFEGDNGEWNCYARVRESEKQMLFYSICPQTAPEDKRQAIAEFIARANYGTVMGNFELDFEDGEIRYKTSIDVEGDRLTPALVERVVYPNVMMMDEYLPGILAVINGEKTPREAISQIEG